MGDTASHRHQPAPPTKPIRDLGYGKLAIAYVSLIIYGSLFPFMEWNAQLGGLHTLLTSGWPKPISRSDLVTNLVIYIPFGLFLTLAWQRRLRPLHTIAVVTLLGTALSFGMEYLQSFLPARFASLFDIACNAIGTLLGALLAHSVAAHSFSGERLRQLRGRLFLSGGLANLGLCVLGLWMLSQLAPLVPSLDRGTLVDGIRPLINTFHGIIAFRPYQALGYALDIAAIGIVASTVLRPGQRFLLLFGVFVYSVLILKIPVIGRQLSLEAISGAAGALLVLGALSLLPRLKGAWPWLAGMLILASYTLDELQTGEDPFAPMFAMNWIPFRDQMQDVVGLEDTVAALWPFVALAYLVLLCRPRHRRTLAFIGALVIGGLVFLLEWMQTHIPGRYPDITDVMLAVGGWSLPWLLAGQASAGSAIEARRAAGPSRRLALASVMIIASGALVAGWGLLPNTAQVARNAKSQLPAPEALTNISLPTFRTAHPRLPAPSAEELARLRRENPEFLQQTAYHAKQGEGQLSAITLLAYAEPGSQNLARLHQRLMELNFVWRGHEQTKPIAVAYDWLYDQWTPEQRRQLRDKLVEGCNYQINFIRKERLSPYNVFLYNSPFQALMACAIAVYRDDPRGDPVMTFTHDYWKNRVLPVWRQVMGRNGGWHEGGEYVGIGIGQAIYQLPAMWRKATGEDLFETEPGIRGFMDFLIYRTRPDGTHMRLGDGGFFDRDVPDGLPLALEFRDAAAYSLNRPRAPIPTSWPWGPLTDDTLYDPNAISALPLTAYFDGIGLLTMRSGWGPDATYITFKAGDNYWSHSHLDQGAFTIYKGGALALDSGLYGPDYGADHHMNYSYQTIAHNTVTVTDPDDTVPIPGHDKKSARVIANDGGQRRIGSGWGVASAPLDLAEWWQKRGIYQTGHIKRLLNEDGLTAAFADLTAAYTNRESGKGTFSHRTRRVEKFTRFFGYDSVDDVVVIYDQVTATQADFRKRWLLHSLQKPELTADGFIIRTPSTAQPGHAGGRMQAHVVLPANRYIQLMGGPGFEFFVDGKNYDEGVAEVLKRRPAEVGAWRVELMPDAPRETDDFLVVLLPTLEAKTPPHQVRPLKTADEVGVEIVGPQRTTRWWFGGAQKAARVEVVTEGGGQTHPMQSLADMGSKL